MSSHVSSLRPASPTAGLALALGAGALILGTTLMTGRRRRRQLERVRSFPDSAPAPARRAVEGRSTVTTNSVTINRPRAELYAVWRDVANLPRFMENVKEIKALGDDR